MNNNLNNFNNCFFSSNTNELRKFLKLSIQLAKESKISLFMSTHQQINILSLVDYKDKDILKNIVFMYFTSIEEVIKKFTELHLWSIRPNFILIDLDGFFVNTCIYSHKHKICFLISSLFSYVDSLENRSPNDRNSVFHCSSAIVLNKFETDCSHKSNVIQILIDFYYYYSSYSNYDMLCERIENIILDKR